jgi:hypothetical protein
MEITPVRTISAVLIIGGLAGASWAQNTAGVDQQPSSNPFNVQQPISTAGMHGRSYAYGNVSPRFHERSPSSSALRFPVTFIPIGGDKTLVIASSAGVDAKNGVPPEQADPFIREPFYPHLTSLLLENEVPRNLQKRLETYRAKRDEAAAAVVAKIAELKDLPADEAASSWTAFEEQEAATWGQIETERADLLVRLQQGGIWARGVKLVDIQELVGRTQTDHQTIPLIDLGTLRHFTAGLSMDQRDLIGEFQLELTEPDTTPGTNRSLLISGTGSRIALPGELTPEQSRALRAYTQTKAELKQEILSIMLPTLRDAMWVSQVERTASRLNKTQKPKFERMAKELEALTLALSKSASDSTHSTARLIGLAPPVDLAAFALMSGSQRRLLAYASVVR